MNQPNRSPHVPADARAWQELERYVELPRLSGLGVSPRGDWLCVGVQVLDEQGTGHRTELWRVDAAGEQPARRLTRGASGGCRPAFLRDGSLVFSSSRPLPKHRKDEGEGLWCLPSLGGEPTVLTTRRGGWEGVLSARDTDQLVLTVRRHVGVEDESADQDKRRRRTESQVSALLHEGAGVRHWDHDLPGETVRFTTTEVRTAPEPELVSDPPRTVTPDLGRALGEDACLAPDASFLVTTWSTALPRGQRHSHLVRIDLADGQVRDLLRDEQTEFDSPVLSPDGTRLACVRHTHGTPHEAPHLVLHVLDLDTGEHHDLAPEWPRWATPEGFSPDGEVLYVTADEDGDRPVFAVEVSSGAVRRLTEAGAHGEVCIAPDGALYAVRTSYAEPGVVVRIDPQQATSTVVYDPMPALELPGSLERVETSAEDGTRVPGWLVLPRGATAEHPVPLVLWIHGGPLGSWNAWSWRWCPWLLASQGWAVLLPDPALSTGYGRDFVQRGWGAWGGAPYTDLMALTDAVLERPELDAQRTAAMGGSFGGYMANWVAGHTDRFRCIVTHASLWNLESFGGTTDAPWYWGREMSAEMRRANSPHLFADAIRTPMLVVHGDKDYRVPIGEGLALWWALVEGHDGPPEEMAHKFLYFPDENHWVLKPQHAIVWYETVRAFLAAHLEGVDFRRPDVL